MKPKERIQAQARFATGKWIFAIAIVGAALAIGALDRSVMCVVAVAVAAGSALLLSGAEPYRSRRCATLLVWLAAGLLAFTVVQAIPIPAGLARALSPHAADIWDRCLRPLGEPGPAWHPLSVDPPATHLEILRGVTYLSALVGALAVARSRDGVRFLGGAVILGGVLVAMGSVVHAALDLDKVYGFVRPKTPVGSIAPLLNSNHAGGYVNIALMLLAATSLSKTPIMPRLLAIIGSVALIAFQFWNASRGAVGSMLVGLLAVFVLNYRARMKPLASNVLLPALLTVGGVGMLVLGAFESSAHGISDTSLAKLKIGVRAIATMVPAYPLFGAGRGAFESTFPEYMNSPHDGFVVFTHPENIVAQWLCEWGVVVSVGAAVTLALALRPRHALVRGGLAIGAWVAIVSVGLQNLVDFSSEVPSVVLALTACAAIVTSGQAHAERTRAVPWASFPRPAGVVLGVAVLLVSVSVAAEHAEVLVDAKRHLRDVAFDRRVPATVFDPLDRSAMLAHPAEPYFSLLGAARALADKKSVLPWIETTLERAPVYAPAHLMLARWLRTRSVSHARLEYRIASEEGTTVPAPELAPLVQTFDDAMEAVPAKEGGVASLEALAVLLAETHPSTRSMIDAEIERRSPGQMPVAVRAANDALADIADDASWCAMDACMHEAVSRAAEVERGAPTESTGYVLKAKLTIMHGETRKGLKELRDACAAVVDRGECLLQLAKLGVALQSPDATADVDALASDGCPWSPTCVQNLLAAAGLEAKRRNIHRELVFLRRAMEVDPDRADVQEQVAREASSQGLHHEAAVVYERLARKNQRFQSLADHERLTADAESARGEHQPDAEHHTTDDSPAAP